MTVVCDCGQWLRVRDLRLLPRLRCPRCKRMIEGLAHQQAARNARVVLDLAAWLWSIPPSLWTPEQYTMALYLYAGETGASSS